MKPTSMTSNLVNFELGISEAGEKLKIFVTYVLNLPGRKIELTIRKPSGNISRNNADH